MRTEVMACIVTISFKGYKISLDLLNVLME